MKNRLETTRETYVSSTIKAAILFLLLLILLVGGFKCTQHTKPFDKIPEEKIVTVDLVFEDDLARKRQLVEEAVKPEFLNQKEFDKELPEEKEEPPKPKEKPKPKEEPKPEPKPEPKKPEPKPEPKEEPKPEKEPEPVKEPKPQEKSPKEKPTPENKEKVTEKLDETPALKETDKPSEHEIKKETPDVPKTNPDDLLAKLKKEEPKKTKTVTAEAPAPVTEVVKQRNVKDDGYTEEQRAKIKEYEERIKQQVIANWRRPPDASGNMVVTIKLGLYKTGYIRSYDYIDKSGGASDEFVKSAQKALELSGAFDVPKDPELFDYFRKIEFVFTPEDLNL